MSSKVNADSFITAIKRSGLVEPDRLQQVLDEINEQGKSLNDSQLIADRLVAKAAITRWQADKLLLGRHRGFFLGKYRLLSLLGKGGMSSVYLAEHTVMRRRCAIKVLPQKRVDDSSYLARFHREAQAVAALDHPNIVRAYDVDQQSDGNTDHHFLVMEYVEGSSLHELVLRDGPLPFEDAADYIRQAALGLAHAHAAGMVHRDIKPGNLLVDLNGTVKLLDLGLARFFREEEGETALTIQHDEKVLGTADYLAPEQALDSHGVDARADIYSLGCTLYFLLTGHPPFTEGTLAQRLMAHQTKHPAPVEQERPGTPDALAAIVRKMMAKSPDQRYQKAQDVADVLSMWLRQHARADWRRSHAALFINARPESPGRRTEVPVAKPVVAQPAAARPVPKPKATVVQSQAANRARTTPAPGPVFQEPLAPPADQPVMAHPPPIDDVHEPELAAFFSQLAAPAEPQSTPASDVLAPESSKIAAASATESPDRQTAGAASPAGTSVVSDSAVAQEFASPFGFSPDLSSGASSKSARSGVRRKRASIADKSRTTRRLAAVATGVLLLAGLGWLASGYLITPSANPPNPTEKSPNGKSPENAPSAMQEWAKRKITVGPQGDYATITAALTDARKHFTSSSRNDVLTITVAGGTYPERIVLEDSKYGAEQPWPKRIHLIAEPGQAVILAPEGTDPIVKLNGIDEFHLTGFELNADGKPVAIVLANSLVGSKLSKLTLNGFTATGVRIDGATGFGSGIGYQTEVVLDQLVFRPGTADAVGIEFRKGETNPRNVIVTGSRFLGPMSAGVVLAGSGASGIHIRESIFAEAKDGVRFQGHQLWKDVTFTNNTFYRTGRGIVFTDMPDAKSGGLAFHRNLFAETTGTEAVVQKDFRDRDFQAMLSTDGAAIELNWTDRDPPRGAGVLDLFGANGRRNVEYKFASTSPEATAFLTPTEPQPPKSRVRGAQKPYIGAVPPRP